MKKVEINESTLTALENIEKKFLYYNGMVISFLSFEHETINLKNIFGHKIEKIYITDIDIRRYSIDHDQEFKFGQSAIEKFLDFTPHYLHLFRKRFVEIRKQLQGFGFTITNDPITKDDLKGAFNAGKLYGDNELPIVNDHDFSNESPEFTPFDVWYQDWIKNKK